MPQNYPPRTTTNPPGQQAGLGYVPDRVKRQSGGGSSSSGGIIISGPPGNATISLDPAVFAAMGMGIGLGQDGEDGASGPPGAVGPQGATGPAGASGASQIGPRGLDGDDGQDGWMGPPGPAGATGATGAAGPAGPPGFAFDGDDGPEAMAIPGIPGSQGPTGPTGPQGAQGVGAVGIPGFDGDEGPEAMAIPGPVGPTGATGPSLPSGASFPGSPAANDLYFRTDRGLIYFYDGTRWLTVNQYTIPLTNTDQSLPMTVASRSTFRGKALYGGTYNFYVELWNWAVFVVTTNTGAVFWSLALQKISSAASPTITTVNTSALSPNAWTENATTVNALLGTSPVITELEVNLTPTGSPGSIYLVQTLVGRLVG